MKKTQKQDTRGQALIFKENRETILYYLTASVVGAIFYSVVHLCIFDSNTWVAWTGFSMSILLEASAMVLMVKSTRCLKGEKGQIIDAGVDLNDTRSYGEYYKDTIILCVIVQLVSMISSYFLLLLLVLPAYGFYKLCVNVLGPWFFAPAPEIDPTEDKRQKRRQKIIYRH